MKNPVKIFFLAGLTLLLSAPHIFAVSGKIAALDHASILEQIETRGSATVLVELSSPEMRLNLTEQSTDATRKKEVVRVQERLQATLTAADRQRVVHHYEYVPGVAMLVDKESLERIQGNEFVKTVYENGMRRPSLSQSTTLVFPNQASSPYNGNNEWAVAVLDTGVDKNHSFLRTGNALKVISEACYSRGGYSTNYPEIDSLCPGEGYFSTAANSGLHCSGYRGCDHGTHVAGIAAGNGAAFNGIAESGKLIAVQVFTGIRDYFFRNVCGTGYGQNCIVAFDIDILRGLERVYSLRNTHKIAAVNMSLGGGRYDHSCDSANTLITTAINNLRNAGIATVIASGNNGYSSSLSFPACISSAIAVGATSDANPGLDTVTYYTNESSLLDLYAPGSHISSSVPGGAFSTMQGTSMAAPHVAGAWAVLKHADPQGAVSEFEALLKAVGPNVVSKNGTIVRKRLNLQAALQKYSRTVVAPILTPLLLTP